MNPYLISEIGNLVIHNVGNKLNNEEIIFSKEETGFDSQIQNLLISYFISPFKSNQYYNFSHNSDINLNEVFVYISKIFENRSLIYEQSINLAKHLYDCSVHPKIKAGEFYITYFRNCFFEGNTVDAIGLFKSESKDTFMKVTSKKSIYEIETESGININKLDKGCLIFNVERENGYVVSVVDSINKSNETIYWIQDFLNVVKREDDFHKTQNILSLCKKFITKELPLEGEVSKAEQAQFLNKSIQFFKEKDSFEMDDFVNDVMVEPHLIDRFYKYKSDYEEQSNLSISDNFTISDTAVKKQSKIFKSILKLDKNFHIYIHGDTSLIEHGVDKDGRKFYKIYYKEEN